MPESTRMPTDAEDTASGATLAQSLMRFLLAIRYRKNVVVASVLAAALLGGLYYATATRYYSAKAAILITQVGSDRLNPSMTGEEALRRNAMPTFEAMVRSAKVLERALETLGAEDRVDLQGAPQGRWVELLQRNLTARAIRATSILEIGYRSRDPHVAVRVVDAIVQSYLEFMRQMHQGTTAELLEQLTKQRAEVARDLRQVQERLVAGRRQLDDVKFDSETKTLHPLLERCVQLNQALVGLQKQHAELEATYQAIRAAVEQGEDLGPHLLAAGDLIGKDVLMGLLGIGSRDAAVQAQLEQRLVDDRAAQVRLENELGPNHPEMVALQERIRQTEEFLAGSAERVEERLAELGSSRLGPWLMNLVGQRLREVCQKEAQLAARYDQARAQAVALSGQLLEIQSLEREEKRLSDEYDELFKKITALDLAKEGSEVRTAVIQQPQPCDRPISPRLSYVAVLVLAGGLGTGIVLVHLLDALDDRFRSIEEIQSRLGTSVLALIRHIETTEATGLEALALYAAPTSPENEAFRTLRTAIELTHSDARQIVISSTEPGDGKTTVLANLGVAYAQAGKKTLLVDADLRRPGLTKLLCPRSLRGLSEILRADSEIAALAAKHVQPTGLKGLDLLPAGPRPANPSELLAGARLSQLLAWAGTVYDHILIDSPPVLATSDAAILGRLVDGVVLVIQPAKNRRRLVLRVVESLTMLKIPILGLVMNRIGSAQYRGYYSYHDSYDYGYGYIPGYGDDEEPVEDRPACSPAESPIDAPPAASRTIFPRALTIRRRVA